VGNAIYSDLIGYLSEKQFVQTHRRAKKKEECSQERTTRLEKA
jgi:hypothetical protein